MNLQAILNSTTAMLLLPGLAVLFANVIFSALRLSRGRTHAGIVTVGLVLGACVLITAGLVMVAFPAVAGDSTSSASAAVSMSGNTSTSSNGSPSNAQSTSPQMPVAADRNVSDGPMPALPSAPNGVPQGQGGFPAQPDAQAGQTAGQNGQAAPIGSTTGSVSASTETIPSSRLATVTVIGAVLVLVAGLIVYSGERRKSGFESSSSAGLLYMGAGIFVLVAALLLPGLPGQFALASGSGTMVGSLAANTGPLPTRAAGQSSSPTSTLAVVLQSTELPTLTPMPIASPTPLFTAIAYAGSTETSGTTGCSVVAQTALNLRGDPSTKQMGIGKVFAGSLLTVTGQSADKKWWRVISEDGGSPVEGWVSADYVTTISACASASIPVVGPSLTPTRTPRPSTTPKSSTTAKPSASS